MLEFIFEKTIGKVVAGFVLVGVLFGWWQWDRAHQRQVGALTERAEISERANVEIQRADEVRRDSERAGTQRVRGVGADPYATVPARGR